MFVFYKALFVIEILIAEFLFEHRLAKRKVYVPRMIAAVAVSVAAAYFVPYSSSVILFCLTFIALFALTVACNMFCYKEPFVNIIFCSIAAYTVQHFSYETANLFLTFVSEASSPLCGVYEMTINEFAALGAKEIVFTSAIYVSCYFAVYAVTYFFFCRRIKKDEEMKIENRWMLFFIAAGLLVNVFFNSVLVHSENTYGLTVSVMLSVYNMICCFFLLNSQFTMLRTEKLAGELKVIGHMLEREKEQYELLSKNIDLVNMKCHDIKHQIREIGSGKSMSSEAITELEKTVNIYDSLIKTGNEEIDVVLTDKTLFCSQNDIALSCAIDGKAVAFMKTAEIYSLFGNIIDNAIDAVMKIGERDKRVISLKVYSLQDCAVINIVNYYEGDLKFDADGLPMTARDRSVHGYGLKSVRYIAENYGGNVSVKADGGIFRLNILLFPCAPPTAAE